MQIRALENRRKRIQKEPKDKRKRKLNESSQSSLLEEIEFSICSDKRDMVKLRNEKSRPVLKEKEAKKSFLVEPWHLN